MTHAGAVRTIAVDQPDFIPALNLALRSPHPPDSWPVSEAADLLVAMREGRLRLSPAFVHGSHCVVLNVQAAGAAALLLLSTVPPDASPTGMTECLHRAVEFARSSGCKLLEVLLDPEDATESLWHGPLRNSGFHFLTRLVYLFQQNFTMPKEPIQPLDVTWVEFGSYSEALFAAALEQSYAGTMDCPELTGVRSTAEVLAGHRATGEFDPSLWWVALRGDRPVGVLLLNRLRGGAAEITYLGVAQVARRSGVADALVARALELCRQRSVTTLALAVDNRNTPANRLYARWGFQIFQNRAAWIAACAQVAVGTDVGNS